MMQYLVILLDDSSVSYCHCDNPHKEHHLIGLDDLRAGILYAMKQNLMIQFVYPDYELPQEYLDVIDTIDHHDIVPHPMKGDVVVAKDLETLTSMQADAVAVLRIGKAELFASGEAIAAILPKVQRLNIVITDIDTFTDDDLKQYNSLLSRLNEVLKEEYLTGHTPQLNLLTDRMMLTKPNHCNAGVENITLAPNGRYYFCPAFYYSNPDDSIDPQAIPNQQLLRLDHAPLCRHCDAYHCRRCVWLNRKTTLEVNTPSHEQCVAAHTERNAARQLLEAIRQKATFMPEVEIKEINYLDPFDVRKEW
ncbi:MAG: CXXX repeat peptide maturase [Bacteroidales bacterium]|nr:CXXX repeat peptide maturase [Bacteroidales bacterium]